MHLLSGEFNETEFQLGLVVRIEDDGADYRVLHTASGQTHEDYEVNGMVRAIIDYPQDGVDAMFELDFVHLDELSEDERNKLVVGSFIHRHNLSSESNRGLFFCVDPEPLPVSEIDEFLNLRASETNDFYGVVLAEHQGKFLDPYGE